MWACSEAATSWGPMRSWYRFRRASSRSPARAVVCPARVLTPQHDVHALTSQFIGNTIDARAAYTDTGANRIHPFVMRQHGDLGARTDIPGAGLDFQQTLFDLSLIHISEPTRRTPISYAVFC